MVTYEWKDMELFWDFVNESAYDRGSTVTDTVINDIIGNIVM